MVWLYVTIRSGITPGRKGLLCFLLSYIVRTNIFKLKERQVKVIVAEACVLSGYGQTRRIQAIPDELYGNPVPGDVTLMVLNGQFKSGINQALTDCNIFMTTRLAIMKLRRL
jgi:hypothetical protein